MEKHRNVLQMQVYHEGNTGGSEMMQRRARRRDLREAARLGQDCIISRIPLGSAVSFFLRIIEKSPGKDKSKKKSRESLWVTMTT